MRFSHYGLTTQLERLARQHGLTLATVLQAVWAILLSVLSGRDGVSLTGW